MAENYKRYECIMLGHNEPMIQSKLDKIPPERRIVGIAVIGVNILAVTEPANGLAYDPPYNKAAALPNPANKRVKI